MKIVLQQYKPSPYRRFLGLGCLAIFVADIVVITWCYQWPIGAPYNYLEMAFYSIGPCLFFGVGFLPGSKMVVDLTAQTYYNRRSLGLFTWVTKRKPLPKADYISVFRQLHADDSDNDGDSVVFYTYDVNLWYDGNKHLTLSTQDTGNMPWKWGKSWPRRCNATCWMLPTLTIKCGWSMPEKLMKQQYLKTLPAVRLF